MAEENLKTKGTEVEEETGFWNRLNIPLPERSTGLFRYIRDFFTCLEFLTRIRMTKREVWFPDDFARSVPYFPLVGGIMGALMWGAASVGALAGFSGNVLGVFLVLAELRVYGYGGRCVQRPDPGTEAGDHAGQSCGRQRSHWRYHPDPGQSYPAGFLFNRCVRSASCCYVRCDPDADGGLYSAVLFPNARPGGLGEMFKTGGSPVYLPLALVLAAGILFYLGPVWCRLAVFSCVPCIALAFYLKWNLGGLTGDTFGFLTECGTVIVLFLAYYLFR